MKTLNERKAALSAALSFVGNDATLYVRPRPTLCAPYDDLSSYGFTKVEWAPFMWIGESPLPKDHNLLTSGRVFSLGLASAFACLQLDGGASDTILDMCAAPGLKSAYLRLICSPETQLYVNDISYARMDRLKRLHTLLGLDLPHITVSPGEKLVDTYEPGIFNKVLIDAPCSGEGKILAGDEKTLKTWSPAKVKRLSRLQRQFIRSAKHIATNDATIIYSTCTLNRTENDKVVKHDVDIIADRRLDSSTSIDLHQGEAVRLLPSEYSIGFFVAKPKSSTIEDIYE